MLDSFLLRQFRNDAMNIDDQRDEEFKYNKDRCFVKKS